MRSKRSESSSFPRDRATSDKDEPLPPDGQLDVDSVEATAARELESEFFPLRSALGPPTHVNREARQLVDSVTFSPLLHNAVKEKAEKHASNSWVLKGMLPAAGPGALFNFQHDDSTVSELGSSTLNLTNNPQHVWKMSNDAWICGSECSLGGNARYQENNPLLNNANENTCVAPERTDYLDKNRMSAGCASCRCDSALWGHVLNLMLGAQGEKRVSTGLEILNRVAFDDDSDRHRRAYAFEASNGNSSAFDQAFLDISDVDEDPKHRLPHTYRPLNIPKPAPNNGGHERKVRMGTSCSRGQPCTAPSSRRLRERRKRRSSLFPTRCD